MNYYHAVNLKLDRDQIEESLMAFACKRSSSSSQTIPTVRTA
jgi:hypothetical protein